jgi:hypothetical protein
MLRSTWETASKLIAPTTFTCVPALYFFSSDGYLESTQKIPPIASISTNAIVLLLHRLSTTEAV